MKVQELLKEAAEPIYITDENDFAFDEDANTEIMIDFLVSKYAYRFGCMAVVNTYHGPGGGWPAVQFYGPKASLEKLIKAYCSNDKDSQEEMIKHLKKTKKAFNLVDPKVVYEKKLDARVKKLVPFFDKAIKQYESNTAGFKSNTKSDLRMYAKDVRDLTSIRDLFAEKKFKAALTRGNRLDTLVRDVIPSIVWAEIGGDVNDKDMLSKQRKALGL